MIWVKSGGKIHEFDAFGWRAYNEEGQDGSLYIVSGDDNQPLRDGSNVVALFSMWEWVRYADEYSELMDESDMKNLGIPDYSQDEPQSVPGESLAGCSSNEAVI